jgi:hypothetical protein
LAPADFEPPTSTHPSRSSDKLLFVCLGLQLSNTHFFFPAVSLPVPNLLATLPVPHECNDYRNSKHTKDTSSSKIFQGSCFMVGYLQDGFLGRKNMTENSKRTFSLSFWLGMGFVYYSYGFYLAILLQGGEKAG